jgi:pimeloyl-ACP methyl ester carboxylesterase
MTTAIEPRTLSVNGVDLRYVDTGAGDPPIVFVHGWTCNRANWRHQIAEFSKDHRVIALDQRGHGESEKPDQDYTIEGFADDLAALIKDLGLERPVIVGHSMGGVIAFHLSRRDPSLARGLVLVDSNVAPLPEESKGIVGPMVAGLQSDDYLNVARGFMEFAFFNEQTDPALKEELIAEMLQTPQRVISTALVSLVEEMSRDGCPVPVPTLMIRASTLVNSPDDLLDRFPGLEVREIAGAHFLQLERPDEVNNAIREFLARLEVEA